MSNANEPTAPAGPPETQPEQAITPGPPPPAPELRDLAGTQRLDEQHLTAEGLARATRHLDGVLAVLVLVLAFALASFAVHNSDFWMHLATGRGIAQGTIGVFAGADPFAYTTAGIPWINHSWLYDWILYGLFGLVGGTGLVIVKGLLVAALALVLFQTRQPGQSLWAPAVCTGLAVLALSPRLLFQPTIVSFLFLGVTLYVLTRGTASRGTDTPPVASRLWLLPPLFALWANLDNWFLLGPIAVALYLLGDWLQQMMSSSHQLDPQSRKKLAMVLLVGLAACLLNPNHIRVFALPPELAYLVVQVTGLQSTEWLAAGTTVGDLQNIDPSLMRYFSPLRQEYWSRTNFGLNVAGLSYFVLLALGLLSFALLGVARPRTKEEGPAPPHGPRLLIWLVFALLSLQVTRVIPFFAVVAGPITALNLQDFALREFGTQMRVDGKWRLWSLGGRLATALGCLGLLFLAWPGWLNASPDEPRLTHRMAWRIHVDDSLRQTAQRLHELHATGKLQHGFNFTPDIADYQSWFCPEAKGFLDYRFGLFAGCGEQYARVRRSLRSEVEYVFKVREDPRTPAPRHEWQDTFRSRGINYLVLTGVQTDPFLVELTSRLWIDATRWTPLYIDGHTVIFGWHDDGPSDQFTGLKLDLNRRAFGPVPEEGRAPSEAPEIPLEAPGFWLRYWTGTAAEPLATATARYESHIPYLVSGSWVPAYVLSWELMTWAGLAGNGAIVPRSLSAPIAVASVARLPQDVLLVKNRVGKPFLRPLDPGPPGAPVLAVRDARRAVAASPGNPDCHLTLAYAYKALWQNQEQFYVNTPVGSGPTAFGEVQPELLVERQTVRRLQFLNALKHYLDLKEEQPSPALADIHWELTQLYLGMNYRDLALDHLAQAREHLVGFQPHPAMREEFKKRREQLDNIYKELSRDVKKRREHFDLQAAAPGQTVLKQFSIAMLEPYRTTDENNRVINDRRGLGLVQLGWKLLRDANVKGLSDEEKRVHVELELRLLLTMGRAREAREGLVPPLKAMLGLNYDHYKAVIGAVTGDYRPADEALADLEPQYAKMAKQIDDLRWRRGQAFLPWLVYTLGFDPPLQMQPVPRAGLFAMQSKILYGDSMGLILPVPSSGAGLRVLRGLLALEQGDTSAAATHFREALRMADPREDFRDRPLVERYVQLLSGS
jgi:hypothetical protein